MGKVKKKLIWKSCTNCINVDVIFVGKNFRRFAIIIQYPCGNEDEIDDKTGNVALHDGRISAQHMLIHDINRITLRYHCRPKCIYAKRKRREERERETWEWKLDDFWIKKDELNYWIKKDFLLFWERNLKSIVNRFNEQLRLMGNPCSSMLNLCVSLQIYISHFQ